MKVKIALVESLYNVTEDVSSLAYLLYSRPQSISRTIKHNSIPIHSLTSIHPHPDTLAAPTEAPHDFSQSFHINFTRTIPNYTISKNIRITKKCFPIFTVYFIHSILTNMFRPVFLPSSGLCSYYKNTVVVNCVTVTAQ